MIPTRNLLFIPLVVLFVGGCVDRAAQQLASRTKAIVTNPVVPVTAAPVVLKSLTKTLEITGNLTTTDDASVGPKNSGRLVAVYVKDGDPVSKNQVIAVQDTSSLVITLQQDMAQLDSAESSLTQAITNAHIGPQKSEAAVLQARAQLAQQKSALEKALNGARPEEKAQADANVASAKSTMDTARRQRDRQRQLLDQGAISQQDFDTAENQFETAESSYQNMLAAQKISLSQTRPEDIQSSRDGVAQAQQGLQTALDSQKLDSLFRDQVNAARAQVNSAQAQVAMARQSISDASIRSPFDGRVSGKPTEAGTVLSPGQQIAHIIGKQGTYFEGQVSENDINKLQQGSQVNVLVDSLSTSYAGHIAAISPSASTVGRLFTVRVQLDQEDSNVKPGMFARGEVTISKVENATVVHSIAVVQQNGQNYVYTISANKAHLQPVTLGLQEGDYTEAKGVREGEQVVTVGQNNLSEGSQVKVQATNSVQASNSGRGA